MSQRSVGTIALRLLTAVLLLILSMMSLAAQQRRVPLPESKAEAAKVCKYEVSQPDRSFAANGGGSSISVTTGSTCQWTAEVVKDGSRKFLSITSGSSGVGNGTVSYTLTTNNSTTRRTGKMMIAGKTIAVEQGSGGDTGRYENIPPAAGAVDPNVLRNDQPTRELKVVKGFADLHTHHMGHLSFDGEWLHGLPEGPIDQALTPCSDSAHKLAMFKPKTESHAMTTQGSPSFRDWPKWNNIGHQAMYEKWVKDAHDQGLTLMVASFTSFEPQCRILKASKLHLKSFVDTDNVCGDMRSVRNQIKTLRDFERRHAWYKIVTTPEQARDAIHAGKLAVVMAIEVSNLFPESEGPWRKQLDEMERLGIVSIQPVHELDNRFGKAALHKPEFRDLDLIKSNKNLGIDQTWVSNLFGVELPKDAALTDDGEALVDTMMKKGMLVDIAHLDPLGTDEVFKIAQRNNYAPIFLSHTYFADLMPPLYADWNKHVTRHQVSQIKQTGGMIGLRTGPDEQLTYRPAKIANNCHGSSRSFAQRYAYSTMGLGVNVGLASDQNGLIENALPRFAGNDDSCSWAYHECKYTGAKKLLGVLTYDHVDCDLSVWDDERKIQQTLQGNRREDGLGTDFDTIGFARTDHLDDLIADIKKLGADTSNIERSSENFIQMWERALNPNRKPLDGTISIPNGDIEPYRDKEARKEWIKNQKEKLSCKTDQDCEPGTYCAEGIGLTKKECKRKLNVGTLCTNKDQCASGVCNVRCIEPNSQPMGGSCLVNAECRVGKCSAVLFGTINGKCVCDGDSDCGGSQYCYKGFADIGTNECRAKKANGQTCTQASQCAGGNCRAGTCYTDASKNFGQSCNFNAECKQGKCSAELLGLTNGTCVCSENSHCGAGNYCDKGTLGAGTNQCKSKRVIGDSCTAGDQCKSGRCYAFKCKAQ